MKDWSAYERPTYTIARIIRFWCEIPDDTPLAVDRRKRIPTPDPSNPLIEARRAILMGALDSYQLPYESADKDWNTARDGTPPQSKTVIRHDALKRWFERYRPYERPAFLFWREDAQHEAEQQQEADGSSNPEIVRLQEEVASLRETLKEPDPRHRKTLLRIIAALLELAEIDDTTPAKTAAHEINAKLEGMGQTPMKPDTIATVINDARGAANTAKE